MHQHVDSDVTAAARHGGTVARFDYFTVNIASFTVNIFVSTRTQLRAVICAQLMKIWTASHPGPPLDPFPFASVGLPACSACAPAPAAWSAHHSQRPHTRKADAGAPASSAGEPLPFSTHPPARPPNSQDSTKPYSENDRLLPPTSPTQGGEVVRAVQLVAGSLGGLLLHRLGAGSSSRRRLAVVTVGVCFLLQHFGLRRQQPVSFLSIAALLALDPTVCLLLQHYGKFLTAAKSAQLLRQQLLRSRSWAETL